MYLKIDKMRKARRRLSAALLCWEMGKIVSVSVWM